MPIIDSLITRDTQGSDLPAELQGATPLCARSCVASYVQKGFTCESTDLSCLCSTYSSDGYTVGELAYGCLVTSCSQPTEQLQSALYNICASQHAPVTATHTSLSLPSLASSTSSVPVTASRASSTRSSLSTTSSAVVAASSTSAPAQTSGLTSAQAIGISVGAFSVLVIAGLIVWLLLWLRRRREQPPPPPAKRGSYDFIDEDPKPSTPPNAPGFINGSPATRIELTPPSKTPQSTMQRTNPSPYSVARSSHESTRTVSQLLPDKPWSSPARVSSESARTTKSQQEPAVPPLTYQQAPARGAQQYRHVDVPPLPQPPLAHQISPQRIPEQTRHLQLPSTLRPAPRSQQALLPPVDVGRPIPRKSASQEGADEPEIHSPETPTPIEEQQQKRRAAPPGIMVPKPVCPERAVRTSMDSDTSFEDDSEDEHPYAPPAKAPVGYPRVARPDAERDPGHTAATTYARPAVIRAPIGQRQPTETVRYYQRLQDGSPVALHDPFFPGGLPTNPRQVRRPPPLQQTSMPLRSPSAPHIVSQDIPLKSPMWTPKLTPTRRGDDLYLAVNMASPGVPPPSWGRGGNAAPL